MAQLLLLNFSQRISIAKQAISDVAGWMSFPRIPRCVHQKIKENHQQRKSSGSFSGYANYITFSACYVFFSWVSGDLDSEMYQTVIIVFSVQQHQAQSYFVLQ